MSLTCNECGGPDALPMNEQDAEPLGREGQVHLGLAEALFVPLGIKLAKGVAHRYFENLAFCRACRKKDAVTPNSFLLVNVLSMLGFFTFILFIYAPVGWLFFAGAALALRSSLKRFNAQPTAGTLREAVGALGTFVVAVIIHTIILMIYGLVFYQLTRDPGFRW